MLVIRKIFDISSLDETKMPFTQVCTLLGVWVNIFKVIYDVRKQ